MLPSVPGRRTLDDAERTQGIHHARGNRPPVHHRRSRRRRWSAHALRIGRDPHLSCREERAPAGASTGDQLVHPVGRFGALLGCALAIVAGGRQADADGGTIRIVEPVGAYIVTVFSAPEPVRVGVADVSVLVQDRTSGSPLLDAQVTLELNPPDAGATPRRLEATRAAATNKLLQAARVDVDRPGTWTMRVSVHRGSDAVEVQGALPVLPPASTLSDIWPYLALPPLAVALYALRAGLVRRRRPGGVRLSQ